MLNPRMVLAAGCVGLLAACGTGKSGDPQSSAPNIANVKSVKSTFGPQFHVTDVGPTGIDPKLLAPQTLPPGMKFDPAGCANFGLGQTLPSGLQGNMAAVIAEGEGNRFIAIAIETNTKVPFDSKAATDCKHVTYSGGSVTGVVDVVDSPQIRGAQTLGTHRQLTATINGQPKTGELYNYVAYMDNELVMVTANPLVVPNQPVVPVNLQRAKDLFTAAAAAAKG
ncbi:MAG: hypothetical protein JWR37_5553 [Mycobacterium sp.]|jgi:hypothetical protein|nr:hypothetical protein [Mycobacterium sp.]